MAAARWAVAAVVLALAGAALAGDENHLFGPCGDTKVQRHDGFTLGIAISRYASFFVNSTTQLSPCDHRLPALSDSNSRLAIFRPKVDEISLLSVNSSFSQLTNNGHMVAFAGRKYAARSPPIFIGDANHMVTSFTLVLEFKKGILQNLYWKKDCKSCSGDYTCFNQECALKATKCKESGGKYDCSSLNIQVAFSGTDKNLAVLNSWYEVSNLRQYSLVGLYSGLKSYLGI